MSRSIKHAGVVSAVGQQQLTVRIVQLSACATCQTAHHCHSTEQKERLVVVPMADTSAYHEGDSVCVSMSAHSGRLALVLGVVAPLVVVLAAVAALHLLGLSDKVAAVGSLAALAPYYIGLAAVRRLLHRHIALSVEKMGQELAGNDRASLSE